MIYAHCLMREKGHSFHADLVSAFCEYSELAQKVRRADKTLNFYALAMSALGVPSTIFAVLTLIRRLSHLGAIYSLTDLASALFHLFGLWVVPARINTEVSGLFISYLCYLKNKRLI